MSIVNPEQSEQSAAVNLDPTIPAPMANATNVAEYGFEGRFADWADDARYFEYSKAANPIGSGHAPQVPIRQFGPEIYLDQPTGVVPLDLSRELGIKTGEATSPALLANFVRIRAGEQIDTAVNATSQLYYVLYGRGFAAVDGRLVKFEKGDFLTLPAGSRSVFYADAETAMYWVHDAPLLRYLGVEAREPRFRATKFARADAVAKLEDIANRPGANDKSRVSVLLANENQEQSLTITHVLWAMFGVLPGRAGAAAAPASVGRTGFDPRCPTERVLHPAGHPPRRARRDRRPDQGGLAGRRRLHHPAGHVACPLQRDGYAGAPDPDPGRGAADLPAQSGHQVHPAPRSRCRLTAPVS